MLSVKMPEVDRPNKSGEKFCLWVRMQWCLRNLSVKQFDEGRKVEVVFRQRSSFSS